MYRRGGRCESIRWSRLDTSREWKTEIRNWKRGIAMRWFSGFFGRRKREKELEAEVQSHLEMAARERMERGMDGVEAARGARREFGNVELVKETTRQAWGWGFLDRLIQDLQFGVRMIAKSPGFAAVGVLTLALGIGGDTALFSGADGVLLNPAPYHRTGQVVQVP